MPTDHDDPIARALRHLTPNYRPAPVIFERGEGPWLYDRQGKRYLDFAAGIAVCSLGHGHPALSAALADQARDLIHVSNLFFNGPAMALAERLAEISFADRTYFGNSGAEANEAALKLARRYMQVVRGEPGRYKFICAHGSFHGRTWAAISATGQPKYHAGFGPLVPGFVHVPFNDLDAMAGAIDDETCAIFVEPIQGESGVLVPHPDYLPGLRRICDARGVLLILDEVQTGVGRTGRWWAHEHLSGASPDIMTTAKGLGGGVPIGVMLCTDEVAQGFAPGVHASTFGGNPLACRAALTVLDTLDREGLLAHVERIGAHLRQGLGALVDRLDVVREVRGAGLLIGLAVDPELDRAKVLACARDRGLLLTRAGGDALRLTPPLIVSRSHADEAVEILAQAIEAASG